MWNPFKKKYITVGSLEERLRKANILNDDEILGVTEAYNIKADGGGKLSVGIFKPNNE